MEDESSKVSEKLVKVGAVIGIGVAGVIFLKKIVDARNSKKKLKKILVVSPENSEQAEKVLKIIEKLSKQKGFECNDCLPGCEYPCKREITITNNKKNSKISCWVYDKFVYDNDYKEGFKEFSIIIFVFDGDKYLDKDFKKLLDLKVFYEIILLEVGIHFRKLPKLV